MKTFAALLILGFGLSALCNADEIYPVSVTHSNESQSVPALHDPLTWPRMTRKEFACFLENKLGFKDKQFSCHSKAELPPGDPCKDVKNYYAGPEFPLGNENKIHPLIKKIDLTWEHGELQSVNFIFTQRLSPRLISKIFSLPQEMTYPPTRKNIMSTSIQDCHKSGNCLLIQGFDHQGAGDIDCSGTEPKP